MCGLQASLGECGQLLKQVKQNFSSVSLSCIVCVQNYFCVPSSLPQGLFKGFSIPEFCDQGGNETGMFVIVSCIPTLSIRVGADRLWALPLNTWSENEHAGATSKGCGCCWLIPLLISRKLVSCFWLKVCAVKSCFQHCYSRGAAGTRAITQKLPVGRYSWFLGSIWYLNIWEWSE